VARARAEREKTHREAVIFFVERVREQGRHFARDGGGVDGRTDGAREGECVENVLIS
jgi:hypothetical protein